MKQIIQSYRNGEVWLAEVPAPALEPRGMLINTAASVVSAGTEKMVLELARKSLVGKAKARPDLVKKVIQKVKTEGFFRTWQKVSSRLDAETPLGYSCSGTVIEVGRNVRGFEHGDRVACAGAGYATHGEYNAVLRNLCVKIPPNVSFNDAAFTTLGAIALQGIRQAEVQLGERVVVLGLGLLGLLTVQMLKTAGCYVLGADPDEDRCALAKELGADTVTNTSRVVDAVEVFSEGRGADAVIITAATRSNEPIETAADIARMKARIVVVGMVGMDVPRNAYYKKELDLRLSMSYGPGRYDPMYEERGLDYPFAYVRWTEQRNMQAFLEMVAAGKVTPSRLVSHQFTIDSALKAYELMQGNDEKYLGILLRYPQDPSSRVPLRAVQLRPVTRGTEPGVGVIGAGNFAKGVLLPALAARKDLRLCGICAKSGASAQESGRKYDFGYATTDHRRIVSDQDVDAVVIATRHGSHAALVRDALQAGKHVFVEKPLAITEAQLDELEAVYRRMGRSPTGRDDEVEDSSAALPALMVGFNRRFSPHAEAVREAFAERATPMIITYRINAGKIPMDSWIQDSEEGGGRIVGEVCHFIDLCEALTGSPVERVTADSIACQDDRVQTDDTVVITLRHHDGSLSTIQYIAIGNSDVPKEAIEVFADGGVAQIDDFRETRFTGVDRVNVKGRQAKGFEEEFEAFFSAIKAGGVPPIPVESLFRVTRVTFAVLRSLHSGESVEIDHPASD